MIAKKKETHNIHKTIATNQETQINRRAKKPHQGYKEPREQLDEDTILQVASHGNVNRRIKALAKITHAVGMERFELMEYKEKKYRSKRMEFEVKKHRDEL